MDHVALVVAQERGRQTDALDTNNSRHQQQSATKRLDLCGLKHNLISDNLNTNTNALEVIELAQENNHLTQESARELIAHSLRRQTLPAGQQHINTQIDLKRTTLVAVKKIDEPQHLLN